jgi:hypothetical protein
MLDQIHVRTIFPVKGHFLNTTLWPTNAIIHPGEPRHASCVLPVLSVPVFSHAVHAYSHTLLAGVSYGIWHDWDGTPVKEAPLFYQNCNAFTGNVLDQLSNETMVSEISSCSFLGLSFLSISHCLYILQSLVPVLESRLGVDMSTLMHIADYQIDCYGHSISDKSSVDRVSV